MLKKFETLFGASIGSFCFSAVWLIFLPLASFYSGGSQKVLAYVIAAAFWLGVVLGTILLFKTNSVRKRLEKKLKAQKSVKYSEGRPGFISFFRNREAKICDVVTVIFLVLVVVFTFLKTQNEWISTILIAALFASLVLRAFLNGKNYNCIKVYKQYTNKKERMNHE